MNTSDPQETRSPSRLLDQSNILDKSNSPIASLSDQQVVIVGGGHVGLSYALLLAHQGIKSTLLEKNRYPQISPDDDHGRRAYLDSRNTALSRRTVQIYQEIGLWPALQSHACRIDAVHISEQGSFGRARLNKDEEKVESFGHVIENAWLGRKLLVAAQQHPLITLIDGADVVAVAQQDNTTRRDHTACNDFGGLAEHAVTLRYRQQSEISESTSTHPQYRASDSQDRRDEHDKAESAEQQLHASVLVACDGRDSAVRQLLDIDTTTFDYGQTAIVGVVETSEPHHHVAIERFSPAGPLALLPLTDADPNSHQDSPQDSQCGYRRSVVWICPKGEETAYLEDDDYFLQTLQRAFGARAGKFVAAGRRGAYPLERVLAQRQVVGRCVIMGNAAHTLHPVAGQGFNLCMRDAHVLAQLMSRQVLKGADIGEETMLKRYEQARRTDQKRVIRFCDAVVHGFTHRNPAIKLARNVALLAFDKLPNVKPLVATYAMGLKS